MTATKWNHSEGSLVFGTIQKARFHVVTDLSRKQDGALQGDSENFLRLVILIPEQFKRVQ